MGREGGARPAGLVRGDRPGVRARQQGAVHRGDRAGNRPGPGPVDRGVRPGRGRYRPGHRRRPRVLPCQRDRWPGRLRRPRCGDHRRRGADGRRLCLGAGPAARGVPMTTLLSRDQAVTAVWDAVAADLTTLWETFGAYTAVVDKAAELLGRLRRSAGRELAEISSLLYGTSVQLSRPSPALARGDLTGTGNTQVTLAAAVADMRRAFAAATAVVTAAEAVWNEVADDLQQIGDQLAAAR